MSQRPSMSMFATRKDYESAVAQRDLNPHKPARMAMWLWGQRYAKSGVGSMTFWDSLSEQERQLCREAVANIQRARDE